MTRADMPDLTDAQPLHAGAIAAELDWLARTITARLEHFFDDAPAPFSFPEAPVHDTTSALGGLIAHAHLDTMARLVLALALAPHVNPALLDPFLVRNRALDRVFSEFGGDPSRSHGGFRPTLSTAQFLLAGADTSARISTMALFDPDMPLRRIAGLALDHGAQTGPDPALTMPTHRVIALCDGQPPRPDLAPDFPARRLTTGLDWDDLVLPKGTLHSLGQFIAWLEHRDRILLDWQLDRQFSPGFRVLFHGPPGTGKTLTAALIGKRVGLDVYRVDLSMLVSKYIGETEKNLAQVFDMADDRNWVLFFDEADALFGSRGGTSTANDRYANQEVSYLLQRVEDSDSLTILATNLRSNIDDAFFRRFQMAIGFTRPGLAERRAIWTGMLRGVPLARDVSVEDLARDHPLSGGQVGNVVRAASITALRRGSDEVGRSDLRQAIAAEMRKEGRTA